MQMNEISGARVDAAIKVHTAFGLLLHFGAKHLQGRYRKTN